MSSQHIIIGTAGHIDHGKTELIKALTGIDTDRLKEEKERGMTIDLGFAWLELPDGRQFGIIDVPGHERFIPNMLAGATSVDYVIFVVAADEGMMPQSIEHLQILQVLGVQKGIIVLTKEDLVDERALREIKEQIVQATQGTFLQASPLKVVSAKTGKGISKLKQFLQTELGQLEIEHPEGVFRMPIDRVFDVKGFGCVITGSVIQGAINLGDEVMVYPLEKSARIRGLQMQNKKVDTVQAGQRAAINLSGLRSQDLYRGCELSLPGSLRASYFLDVQFHDLESHLHQLKVVTEVKLYRGTQECLGRLVLLDKDSLPAGQEALAQLRLKEKAVACPDDLFVLRLLSPPITLGGGKILRISEMKTPRKTAPHITGLKLLRDNKLEQYCKFCLHHSDQVILTHSQLSQLLQFQLPQVQEPVNHLIEAGSIKLWQVKSEKYFIIEDKFTHWREQIITYLIQFHRQNPLAPGCSLSQLQQELSISMPLPNLKALLTYLQARGDLNIKEDVLSLPGFTVHLTDSQFSLKQKIEQIYGKALLKPPDFKTLCQQLHIKEGKEKNELRHICDILINEGVLVKIKEGMMIRRVALEQLLGRLYKKFRPHQSLRVTEFKALFNLTRKYAIPLLEYLDMCGITIRRGDMRELLEPKKTNK